MTHPVKRAARHLMRTAVAATPAWILQRALPHHQRLDASRRTPAVQPPSTGIRLLVAPTNTAGQGWAMARAAEVLSDVGARTVGIVPAGGGFGYPADQVVTPAEYRWSTQWQRAQRRAVLAGFTHALVESGRPLFGDTFARPVEADLRAMDAAGISVALYFHGSEVRLPSRHLARTPDSPFAPGLWPLTPALEHQARRMHTLAQKFAGAVFVSTPDLLLDVPFATWLPVSVDPAAWVTLRAPFSTPGGPPIVSHVPSNAIVKGTDLIEPLLLRLHDEGVIRYAPLRGLQASEMVDAYQGADIVLDQFRIGTYGVAACEAMAAGRIVISNLGDQVRAEAERQLGEAVPIIESTAHELEEVLRGVIADPEAVLPLAERGPHFVRRHHDGRRSAEVLTPWLKGSRREPGP